MCVFLRASVYESFSIAEPQTAADCRKGRARIAAMTTSDNPLHTPPQSARKQPLLVANSFHPETLARLDELYQTHKL